MKDHIFVESQFYACAFGTEWHGVGGSVFGMLQSSRQFAFGLKSFFFIICIVHVVPQGYPDYEGIKNLSKVTLTVFVYSLVQGTYSWRCVCLYFQAAGALGLARRVL